MDFKAIVFDAYGTLFDVNSAAEKCKHKIGDKWEAFANFWRTTQLEYTWLRSLMKRHKDFWQVTEDSLEKCQNLKNFLGKNSTKIELIFTDLNTENKQLHIKKQIHKPICIIVGPEGDFSEKERKEILSFEGVNKIKINENILRSETAAISALSIVNYAYNL